MRPWLLTVTFLLVLLAVSKVAQRGTWTPPASASPYLPVIDKASADYKLPPKLLARLLYQESRFRADIITGAVRSDGGAVGIAQIIPKWHPSLDGRPEYDHRLDEAAALDPSRAIPYAARFLRELKDRFGTWELALAGYNWGPTALARSLAEGRGRLTWPAETQLYVTEIAWDTGV